MKNNIKFLRANYHLIIMKICYRIDLILPKIHTKLENIVLRHDKMISDIIGDGGDVDESSDHRN